MRGATILSLLGAASAAYQPAQQPLKLPHVTPESWAHPLKNLKDALHGLTAEARQVWDEVAMMFPESFDKANFFSQPKPHTRRPNHEWDHVMRGEDIQSVWTTNAQGEKEREIDGKLSNYNLRTKAVDPSVLGVDKVKQYSGYLDDEEEDKHLFYCKEPFLLTTPIRPTNRGKGFLNPEMTPRTTPWSFGSTEALDALP
jgi:cathepsin A (carboxypeptidase C)